MFELGDSVAITAAMNLRDLINNAIHIDSVDFYLDDHLVGTDLSTKSETGDLSWTVEVPFNSPGIHALVAVGHASSGRSYSTFRTVLVEGAVPEPTSLATALLAATMLSLRKSRHRESAAALRYGHN